MSKDMKTLLIIGGAVILFVLLATKKSAPPPALPPQFVVIPAVPVPPVQATPWPQLFFPSPSTTIIDVNQLTAQQQLLFQQQLQQQLQQQWVYDPIQRKMVRRSELAATTP